MALVKTAHILIILLLVGASWSDAAMAQMPGSITADEEELVFMSVKGSMSRLHSLVLTNTSRAAVAITPSVPRDKGVPILTFEREIPKVIKPGQSTSLFIRFTPDFGASALMDDGLRFETVGNGEIVIPVRALAIDGLNVRDEPPLTDIFQALGYDLDPGWEGMSARSGVTVVGDEIPLRTFRKVLPGNVTMRPLARFSRDGKASFGYYPVNQMVPETRPIGILERSGEWHEHKTIIPKLADGSSSFDPGEALFSLFVSLREETVYGEDRWNKQFNPELNGRAMRVYPVKSRTGEVEKNAVLVCFEESTNGTYQDYVFLVSNVVPVEVEMPSQPKLFQTVAEDVGGDPPFRPLLHEDNLDGWITYLKKHGRNRDPNLVFDIYNGVLRISGDELGYLRTEEAFESFHLKFEYRWEAGSQIRQDRRAFEGGLIYYVEEAQVDHVWPRGIEFDLRENDSGDIWLHAGTTIKSSGSIWGAGRPARVVKSRGAENTPGEWNTVEIIADNGKITHIVNGVMVNAGYEASIRRGRIALLSAGNEIHLRNMQVRKWRPEPAMAGGGR